ncbi:MAG: hypothetical protein SX243_14375 [Acidobacteriota bacterium]|nr:hypothetical protein [Acidobacteriota bacterium]
MTDEPKHLTQGQCDALMRGELPPRPLAQQLFQHLLDLCPVCLEAWQSYRQALSQASAGALPGPPETAEELSETVRLTIERISALRERVQRERGQADELLRELRQLPDLRARVTRVRRSRRFRSWALCERLFQESHNLSFERPAQAADFAELAIEAAWALDDQSLGRELISDLLARGWVALGNARRLGGQPSLAAETFAMGQFFLEQGSGDPLVLAEIAGLEALLRRDQRYFPEAMRLHDRCVTIYRDLEDEQQLGSALLQRAVTRAAAGELEAAVSELRRSLELLDPEVDSRLALCARHTLILYLQRLGEQDEAELLLAELAPTAARPTDPWSRLRRRWLDAEMARAAGRAEEAESAFAEVHWAFVEGGVFHRGAMPPRSLMAVLADSADPTQDA